MKQTFFIKYRDNNKPMIKVVKCNNDDIPIEVLAYIKPEYYSNKIGVEIMNNLYKAHGGNPYNQKRKITDKDYLLDILPEGYEEDLMES